MPTLPTPGADYDSWGTELNEFLEVAHAADGRLFVTNASAANVPLTVKGAASQSANYLTIEDSTGEDRVTVNSRGQMFIWNDTSAQTAGEVAGLKISIGEPSPSNPSTGDYVGFYVSMQTSADREYVWAANPITEVVAAHDGTAWGLEVDINNNGSDADVPGPFHKIGVDIVTGNGINPGTAALTVNTARTGGAGWHHGLYIRGVIDSAITITDNASGGFLMPTIGVSIGNPSSSLAGPIITKQFANNGDSVVMQRYTDTAPTGYFLSGINAANNDVIFTVAVDGAFRTDGTILSESSVTARGDLVVQPSSIVFHVASDGTIRTNQVAASAVPATQNKRFPVYNTSGGLEGYVALYNT